jgi:hypothetical protein
MRCGDAFEIDPKTEFQVTFFAALTPKKRYNLLLQLCRFDEKKNERGADRKWGQLTGLPCRRMAIVASIIFYLNQFHS